MTSRDNRPSRTGRGRGVARTLVATGATMLIASSAIDGHAAAGNPWASDTFSPRPGLVDDPRDAPLAALCKGGVDSALVTVASELAESLATHGELPDAAEIEWRQRKAGSPHVWPKTWGAHVKGSAIDRKTLVSDVSTWLGATAPRARCGVASRKIGSHEAIAIIAVDPVAELAAMPTRAKIGAFLELDATLLRGATSGRVVLLPPSGAPRTILSTATAPVGVGFTHLRARVPMVSAGRHVVQVLADDANGPRPVLEAEVWASVDPPMAVPSPEVPGETKGDSIDDPADALFARLNAARAAEGMSSLARDVSLDKLAASHAAAMRKAKLLGHDVGDGDPASRAAAAGIFYKIVGENVAKAKSDKSAHRALYASPSHRGNMLEGRFRRVGIGVSIDPVTSELWVAEMFGG